MHGHIPLTGGDGQTGHGGWEQAQQPDLAGMEREGGVGADSGPVAEIVHGERGVGSKPHDAVIVENDSRFPVLGLEDRAASEHGLPHQRLPETVTEVRHLPGRPDENERLRDRLLRQEDEGHQADCQDQHTHRCRPA